MYHLARPSFSPLCVRVEGMGAERGGGGVGKKPWYFVLVCSWRRPLAGPLAAGGGGGVQCGGGGGEGCGRSLCVHVCVCTSWCLPF